MESVATVLARLPLPGEVRHTRIERCACGGMVRADHREPANGVASHNRTKVHRAWRQAHAL